MGRLAALAAVLALVLTACGGGGDDAGTEQKATPTKTAEPFEISQEQINRTVKELDLGSLMNESPKACFTSEKPKCQPSAANAVYTAARSAQGARLSGAQEIRGRILVMVMTFKDEAGAKAALAHAESADLLGAAKIDIPIKGGQESYDPGERGTGTKSEIDQDEWVGFHSDGLVTFVLRGLTAETKVRHNFIGAQRGRYVINLSWYDADHPRWQDEHMETFEELTDKLSEQG